MKLGKYLLTWFRYNERRIIWEYLYSNKGPDSLDENVITKNTDADFKTARLFDQKQNDLNRYFNVYHQIDKLTNNAQMLAKKLETTEL